MPGQGVVREEAGTIELRLERYTRAPFEQVKENLSRGECDQLNHWRRIVPLEEFSAAWCERSGDGP